MKALSIRQPWAELIARGIKDIENRTWKTNYRGRIYIHVSATKKFNVDLTDEQTKLAVPVLANVVDGNMSFGAIIGEVDIVDCVLNHKSIWAQNDTYNWVLANATFYIHPYRNVKGKLSFWEFDKHSHLFKKQ